MLLLALLGVGPAVGLTPDRVLVIVNGADPDSAAVGARYAELRPGVLTLDLANPTLVGRPTIDYDTFREALQRPLRRYLVERPGLAERILCLALTKGIPHRLDDLNRPGVGDRAETMREEWLERGDFTAASVDSELTLLWQDLPLNDRGGFYDSKADGFILNPYHGERRPFAEFDRAHLTRRKRFIDILQAEDHGRIWQAGWQAVTPREAPARLTPGDIYLVVRLDGPTLPATLAALDRAQDINFDQSLGVILLDANAAAELDQADYVRAAQLLRRHGWGVVLDRTENFLTGAEVRRPLIAYASYGANDLGLDAPTSTGYIGTFRFAPGAIFNTLESFNGRAFGGLGDRPGRPQTQLADFIAAGGTLGIGNVWEPFSFSAAQNEVLLDAFLNRGLTWAEAAYASLFSLSWQQIVVGDPLARARVLRPPAGSPNPFNPAPAAGSGR